MDKGFGPFTLFDCRKCGSLGTANPPNENRLAEFYQNYDQFRPDWYKAGSEAGALAAQYHFYSRLVSSAFVEGETWADVGSGHGEVANLVGITFPDGTAIDIGDRPTSLNAAIDYRSVDMNAKDWSTVLAKKFDKVFSVAVWEHVLDPMAFARECISLVKPGGQLTLITPDYGSFASRLLRDSWPYFEPGEHLNVPTKHGAQLCLIDAANALSIGADITVKSLNVGYSLRYLFEVTRLKALARLTPSNLAVPLPTGILTATVDVHQ